VVNFDSTFFDSNFGFIFTLKTGRILTACFGVLLVYFVYLIGKRFFNREVAVVSALIMAVSRPLVIDSHVFKPDSLVSLLLVIVLYFSLQYVQTGEPKKILLAGFFLGLSVVTKYNAIFMALFVIIALFLPKKIEGRRSVKKSIGFLIFGGLGGFVIGAPNWILHPVENFKQAIAYLKFLSSFLNWYDPMPSSYILYSKNILESFGLILTVLLILGLIFSFVKKEKISIFISLFVLMYFLLIGSTGYLNYRALLPIFSGIALLIGKFLFQDLKTWFQNLPKIKVLFSPLIWIVVIVIIFQQTVVNLKSFNLLKTVSAHPSRDYPGIGQPDYSRFFMNNHINRNFSFFREMWTPPVTGYSGSDFARDVTVVPLNKFRGSDSYHFLITSFRTNYILSRSKNQLVKKSARKRLENYFPFYQVYRPRIFYWNDDITFWYRKSRCIKTRVKADPLIKLPRLFYHDEQNPTVYLPLQLYEKNPNFGIIKKGRYQKRFFSKKEIGEIGFVFLNPGVSAAIEIKINNVKKTLTFGGGEPLKKVILKNIQPEIFSGFPIRRLYEVSLEKKDKSTSLYLYSLELDMNQKIAGYFVYYPSYRGEELVKKQPIVLADEPLEEIPPLFSQDPYPQWICRFYRQTGIDLGLLLFMNQMNLYENPSLSVEDFSSPFFPLEKGVYIIKIDGTKIIDFSPISDQLQLRIELISDKIEKRAVKFDWEKQKSFLLKIDSDISFIRLVLKGCGKSNYLIREISLAPDYKTYINNNFVQRNN
jgi:hypothetical protein